MEIAGQMALKHKKTAYHDTSTLNILYFNVNSILGTQKPRKKKKKDPVRSMKEMCDICGPRTALFGRLV